MITMLLAIALLGGPPVLTPGERVQVPDRFYRRLLSVDELPKSYGTLDWTEARFGTWLEASAARGPLALHTIEQRLGPALALPDWGSRRARTGYVFALRASDEAGLIILIDRNRQQIELKDYSSFTKPSHIASRPPSHEWESMLMLWFRWLTTPDDKLPPDLCDAAKDGFPPIRATGIDPITGKPEHTGR